MGNYKNYKRLKVEKLQKKAKEIHQFLRGPNREQVVELIKTSTSSLNKDYFDGDELINILEMDPIEAFDELRRLKRKSSIVSLLERYNLLHYIVEFESFQTEEPMVQRIRNFFSSHPEVDEIIKSYKVVETDFALNCKRASKLFSTALNQPKDDDKLRLLKDALVIAPWGSIESLRIVQNFILIQLGWRIGKSEEIIEKERTS